MENIQMKEETGKLADIPERGMTIMLTFDLSPSSNGEDKQFVDVGLYLNGDCEKISKALSVAMVNNPAVAAIVTTAAKVFPLLKMHKDLEDGKLPDEDGMEHLFSMLELISDRKRR